MLVITVSVSALLAIPTQAQAATRRPVKSPKEIIARASSWVRQRVGYSQYRYKQGYRRDCSGMVSMAWGLTRSYTSSTIRSQAKRISKQELRPGDAVRIPGHVSIFAGWKNKRRGEYIALEQTTWGSHAKRHVRRFTANATALRSKHVVQRRVTGTLAVLKAKNA